jgi:hypothetical protein
VREERAAEQLRQYGKQKPDEENGIRVDLNDLRFWLRVMNGAIGLRRTYRAATREKRRVYQKLWMEDHRKNRKASECPNP